MTMNAAEKGTIKWKRDLTVCSMRVFLRFCQLLVHKRRESYRVCVFFFFFFLLSSSSSFLIFCVYVVHCILSSCHVVVSFFFFVIIFIIFLNVLSMLMVEAAFYAHTHTHKKNICLILMRLIDIFLFFGVFVVCGPR